MLFIPDVPIHNLHVYHRGYHTITGEVPNSPDLTVENTVLKLNIALWPSVESNIALSKSLDNGITGGNEGSYTIFIHSQDTENLRIGQAYWYTLWFAEPNTPERVIAQGLFLVHPTVKS